MKELKQPNPQCQCTGGSSVVVVELSLGVARQAVDFRRLATLLSRSDLRGASR